MGPISQLELDELDGATAVSGTMLTDLSCHEKILPAGAAWGRGRAVRALGLGTTLRVRFPCRQETGCGAAHALLIPGAAASAPLPAPTGRVLRVGSRGGRCGEGWRQPGSFGSVLPNWELLFTSPGSGRWTAVSWSCWQAWAAGEGGTGAASAPTVQTGWATAAAPQRAVTSPQHLSLHCWC